MLDVVWDMETQDPDDFLTLLLLLGHPQVNLKAVTITPGSAHQVGVVCWALERFARDIPVGANNIEHPKTCVSSWHYKAYGDIPPSTDARPGGEVMHEACDEHTTLITGAPLKNLGDAMNISGFRLGRLFAQGGFAGEGVVPEALQLPKFKGRRTCPTFNLNGAPNAALQALVHPGIGARYFVSKNVCHGVVYTEAFHERLAPVREGSASLELLWQGMESYLAKKRKPGADRDSYGKKLHDPLAACCAIDPEIGSWAEVELFRERGEWGARLAPGSGTKIIVDYDPERFFEVFSERS